MTDSLLAPLLAQTSSDPLAKDAADYCQQYGALNRQEAWRWLPLQSLQLSRKIADADYQYNLPEDWLVSCGREAFSGVLEDKNAPFAALNIALHDETLLLEIPEQTVCEDVMTIHIDALGHIWQFSRLEVVVGRGAKAALWLDFGVENNAAQVPLVQFSLLEAAELEAVVWLNAQDQSSTAQTIFLHSQQDHHSRLAINAAITGGALARVDMHADLHGQSAQFSFGGVQSAARQEIHDYHVQVRHLNEACSSEQIIRGVLNDQAQGFFDGLIFVQQDAQLTAGRQDSRYLLLSPQARAQSMPRLEIYADDVQCAHGATVGFLDAQALFYLQTRGIDLATARSLLMMSFVQEAVVLTQDALRGDFVQALQTIGSQGAEDEC